VSIIQIAKHTEKNQEKWLVYQSGDLILLMPFEEYLEKRQFLHLEKPIKPQVSLRKVEDNRYYTHYKNKAYLFLRKAIDAKTGEQYVVYMALYGEFDLWIRPLDMFLETLEHQGKTVNRFEETK
jgi:hypothetical protein